MAVAVTGDVLDLGGQSMAEYNAEVIFELNRPNIMATGGGIRPGKSKKVIPGSDGKFSTSLEPTVSMLADAWYKVRVQWLDAKRNLIAYLDFQIRVPTGGGNLSDLADFSGNGGNGGGANQMIWWVGLTAPPSKRYLWLHMNPQDNTDPAGTGDVRQWR